MCNVTLLSHTTESKVTDRDKHFVFNIFMGCFLQCKNGPLPIMKISDPIDREIEFVPPKTPYDPRHFICGTPDPGIHFALFNELSISSCTQTHNV